MHLYKGINTIKISIGAFPNNVPVVVILSELYTNPIIVVNVDGFKLKFVAIGYYHAYLIT